MTEGEKQPTVQVDEKQALLWATLCHVSALAGFIGIPLGNIFGPLIVWLIKKNEIAVVDKEGKEALNFQISMTIYLAVAGLLCFLVIGIPILIGLVIADIVLVIVASIKVNNGESFQYPITIRFLR